MGVAEGEGEGEVAGTVLGAGVVEEEGYKSLMIVVEVEEKRW